LPFRAQLLHGRAQALSATPTDDPQNGEKLVVPVAVAAMAEEHIASQE
jgi:hypothetical protein